MLLLLLSLSLSGAGIAAFEPGQVYSALEKAFYLSQEDAVWIRPGLNVKILDVQIPADRRPVVTLQLSDGKGQPLDREGNLTPGSVSMGIILAYLRGENNQYWTYSTRAQKSPITGVTENQAAADSGGVFTSLGDGLYSYKFKTVLPENYDRTATHTLGVYASRNLAEFGMSRYVSNQVQNFVPDGSQVRNIREVTATANCNKCHNPLRLHGETGREAVEICILCHTPQSVDPDTGETTDMKVMIHKIHRGKNLPSVKAGKPYRIIGHGQSVIDYSHIGYPQDIRNCRTCHQNTQQVNNWLLNPTRETCGSCHDHVDFKSGKNHAAGAHADDTNCARCHTAQASREYDASIIGAHVPEYRSEQLRRPKVELLGITNTGPGQNPTVQFKLLDKDGALLEPAAMASPAGRLGLTLAGPTGDYRWYIQEQPGTKVTVENGIVSYTFAAAMPASASGTYTLEAEGYMNATLNPGTTKQVTVRDTLESVTMDFAVSGNLQPRRQLVDMAKCNNCHDKLAPHGGNRNTIESCVLCHNPAMTDVAVRPKSDLPTESIDMKILAHKIHTGEELKNGYVVYGRGSTRYDFAEVLYPGDRRDCLQCHVAGGYTLPLASSATPSTTPRNFWDPTSPTAAACLGCHDSVEAAAHAFLNTASFGESCSVCHKEGAEFAVSKVHAR
jgi:OmcA/MtrC family decaheme c-type cytochrome